MIETADYDALKKSIAELSTATRAILEDVVRRDERIKCAQIASRECSCGEPFERCHVAQEILLAREGRPS